MSIITSKSSLFTFFEGGMCQQIFVKIGQGKHYGVCVGCPILSQV